MSCTHLSHGGFCNELAIRPDKKYCLDCLHYANQVSYSLDKIEIKRFRALAASIILSGVQEYNKAKRAIRNPATTPEQKERYAYKMKQEEKFFRSTFCEELLDFINLALTPEQIMEAEPKRLGLR